MNSAIRAIFLYSIVSSFFVFNFGTAGAQEQDDIDQEEQSCEESGGTYAYTPDGVGRCLFDFAGGDADDTTDPATPQDWPPVPTQPE